MDKFAKTSERAHCFLSSLLSTVDSFQTVTHFSSPVALRANLYPNHFQVAVAAFRYLAEDGAVAGRHLPWDQPQLGGKVALLEKVSPAPIAATIALEE